MLHDSLIHGKLVQGYELSSPNVEVQNFQAEEWRNRFRFVRVKLSLDPDDSW